MNMKAMPLITLAILTASVAAQASENEVSQ